MASAQKTVEKKGVIVEGSLEVHPDFALLALSPGVFPLPVVYAASREFLDRVYVMVDGDPEGEIVIELRPKKTGVKLLGIGRELGNLLVSELERYHHHTLPNLDSFTGAFAAAGSGSAPERQKEMSYLDDPLGIMKPWSGEKK